MPQTGVEQQGTRLGDRQAEGVVNEALSCNVRGCAEQKSPSAEWCTTLLQVLVNIVCICVGVTIKTQGFHTVRYQSAAAADATICW